MDRQQKDLMIVGIVCAAAGSIATALCDEIRYQADVLRKRNKKKKKSKPVTTDKQSDP